MSEFLNLLAHARARNAQTVVQANERLSRINGCKREKKWDEDEARRSRYACGGAIMIRTES